MKHLTQIEKRAGKGLESTCPQRSHPTHFQIRKMITEITATTETAGMATTMAGKKENPVETAEETGTATGITGTATAEMATMEMAAEIPITREEAGIRAES